jgi:hypothetical protein
MSAFENHLLIFWLTFVVLSVAALIPIIRWAIRSGQFSHNAAAQYLPLKSGIPDDRVARPKRSVAVVNSDDNKDTKNVQP